MIGPESIAIVGGVVLLLFGGKKIPELMHGLGQGLGEFRKGVEDARYSVRQAIDAEVRRHDPEPPLRPLETQPVPVEPHAEEPSPHIQDPP